MMTPAAAQRRVRCRVAVRGFRVMSRGRYAFKESEITRAIRAAKKAGIADPIVEIDIASKRIRIRSGNTNEDRAVTHNEWDAVLNSKDE